MKQNFIFLALSALVCFSSCSKQTTEPDKPQSHLEVRAELVSHSTVPHEWDSTYYQLSLTAILKLWPLDTNKVDSIANAFMAKDLEITDLWSAYCCDACMAPYIGSTVLVKLAKPDSSIVALGFKKDELFYPIDCIDTWKHYEFVKVTGKN